MNFAAWEEELQDDVDRTFILNGIKNGFDIIDPALSLKAIELDNHFSASEASDLYEKATSQILQEIELGNYVQAPCPPTIVSPLGVIPKSDGGVRLIHDCSRPKGFSVNDYETDLEKHRYQSVDDACKLVEKGSYLAKIDLKSAYRSIPISKHSMKVTGLKWKINNKWQYFYDSKLPFGSRAAPGIFHRLSQAVRRMMSRQGFIVVVYLDDFLICEKTKNRCALAMRFLISLLRKLGFSINWKKEVDPSQVLVFLGIETKA